MALNLSKEDIPLHLRGPPFGRKQTVEDAKVPPLPCLFRCMLPGIFGNNILPPRLEFGCWISPERMLEIAEKLGCLINPVDREVPGSQVTKRVRSVVHQKINKNLQMKFETVFTGIPNEEDEINAIYSFGSSHNMKNFPSRDTLVKLVDTLELKGSDMKWWVSEEEWYWRRVDRKKEQYIRQVVDAIIAEEYAGVFERAADHKRMKEEAEKRKAEEERMAEA